MFSFFAKKEYLIDYLKGFVDIHNHILPGIDDGAKNVEESIELLNGFSQFGVSSFICTPHVMASLYPNTAESITKSFLKLSDSLKTKPQLNVQLSFAGEHLIDEHFESKVENNEILPINKHYLLVEMSFIQAPLNFNPAINKIREKGLYPILAHPERYGFIPQKISAFNSYKSNEVRFQVNLLSLAGYYGKDIQKTAFFLLDNGLVDFFGSDIHRLSQLDYLKECVLTKNQLNLIDPIIYKTINSFN